MEIDKREKVRRFINGYERKHGIKPTKAAIQEALGLHYNSISRFLDKDYPKELLLTREQLDLLKIYKHSMTIHELALVTGKNYQSVACMIYDMNRKGVIKYDVMKYQTEEERKDKVKHIYIKCIRGPYKGCGGYIESSSGKIYDCVVYKNKQKVQIKLSSNDFTTI